MENTEKKKRIRIGTLKQIKLFYAKLINDYYTNGDDELSENKFKNLIYALNGLSKVIESSEIESRIEALENNMLLDPNNPNKE